MLYDPKWEVKSEPRTLAHFIAWLATQPADRAYDWYDVDGCVVCEYLKSCGFERPASDPRCGGVTRRSITDWDESKDYWDIAETRPWTFGAVLDRARAVRDR